MANFIPDVEQQADEIEKRAVALRAFKLAELNREELGVFNFRDAIPVFERSFGILLKAASVDLRAVPAEHLRNLNQRLDVALKRIDSIRSFDPQDQSPRRRDDLIRSWASDYLSDYEAAGRCLAAAPFKEPDFSAQEKTIQERLAVIRQAEVRIDDLEKTATARIEEVLKAARSAAVGTGITHQATQFEEEAKVHRNASIGWLFASAAMAIGTACFGLWIASNYASPRSSEVAAVRTSPAINANASSVSPGGTASIPSAQNQPAVAAELPVGRSIQLAVARLFVFSVLYFATVWCGRNYKAHKHNQVVNRHRQHALRTFEAFVASTGDAATKNAVLLQTTAAIFSLSGTGFSSDDGDSGSQPKIIEMIKTINSGKSD
jgi:hypothetical protein